MQKKNIGSISCIKSKDAVSTDWTLTRSAELANRSHPTQVRNGWHIHSLMLVQDPYPKSSHPMGQVRRGPSGSHRPLRLHIAALGIQSSMLSAFLCLSLHKGPCVSPWKSIMKNPCCFSAQQGTYLYSVYSQEQVMVKII